MKKIMFVCYANTCRSAMAEAIFKQMVEGKMEVYSSGIKAKNGKKPSKKTVDVCRSYGIDVSNHTALNYRDSNIADMDLVLTLEESHREKVMIYYPDLEVYTIRQFIQEYPRDINDPVGREYKVYDACFREIRRCLEKVNLRIEF